MRLGPKIITAGAVGLALLLSWLSATLAAGVIEARSGQAVKTALIESNHAWAEVHTDGLQVHIGGIAPTEAARFNALSVSGAVVEASRVIDGTTVTPAQPIAPPRFSVEILRNEDGVSLIGLVPDILDRAQMVEEITALAEGAEVTDFLETASHPVPGGWVPALNYALDALARLPRSKVSVSSGEVAITAVTSSIPEQRELEILLARLAPDDITIDLDIRAPRPVISPFTLRFQIDGERGVRFDACSADSPRDRDRILAAAHGAGLEGRVTCTLGLGVPTPEWANAVIMGIEALAEIGHGTVTFSDADVALVAAASTDPALFDRVVGALESNLPEVFSLKSVLLEPETADEGPLPVEFSATRSPEGQVQLRGRLPDAAVHGMVESFAQARFGVEAVYMAARQEAEGLPADWPVRVLAGLTALSEVDYGALTVLEDSVELRGTSGDQNAAAEIARLLTDELGSDANLTLDVSYDERLDPLANIPTAEECIRRIEVILSAQKITFEPGSTEVAGESAEIVSDIADVLRECRQAEMSIEIAGHTDSQGREQMNLELSEARARAVLDALAARRVLVSQISSKGYGETVPIADNDTEEGREANRRIEFRLVIPEDSEETASAEGVAEGEGENPADTSDEAPEDGSDGEESSDEESQDAEADPASEEATDSE